MRTSVKGKGGKKPRSVFLEVAFWKDGDAIHVASNDPEVPTFHIMVRADGSKKSGHPYLYRELEKCLAAKGV